MRGGGKIENGEWTARAQALRPGDVIRCASWFPAGECWWGGPQLEVVKIGSTGKRDGFLNIDVKLYGGLYDADRQLCIRKTDKVQLSSRSVEQEIIVVESKWFDKQLEFGF
jgi:hypothetical protein